MFLFILTLNCIANIKGVQQPPLPFGSQPPAPDAEYAEEGEYMEEVQDEDFREHQQFRDRDDRDRRDRRRRSRDRSRSRSVASKIFMNCYIYTNK